jgi:NAD(P)H-quinone oxidoreductase subunit L
MAEANMVETDVLITLGLYVALGGAYLIVVPALVFAYMQARWYVASSMERGFMYFLVFLFFPGLLALAPFLNPRPKPRQIV